MGKSIIGLLQCFGCLNKGFNNVRHLINFVRCRQKLTALRITYTNKQRLHNKYSLKSFPLSFETELIGQGSPMLSMVDLTRPPRPSLLRTVQSMPLPPSLTDKWLKAATNEPLRSSGICPTPPLLSRSIFIWSISTTGCIALSFPGEAAFTEFLQKIYFLRVLRLLDPWSLERSRNGISWGSWSCHRSPRSTSLISQIPIGVVRGSWSLGHYWRCHTVTALIVQQIEPWTLDLRIPTRHPSWNLRGRGKYRWMNEWERDSGCKLLRYLQGSRLCIWYLQGFLIKVVYLITRRHICDYAI